jgi:hypothetical protein
MPSGHIFQRENRAKRRRLLENRCASKIHHFSHIVVSNKNDLPKEFISDVSPDLFPIFSGLNSLERL